MGKYSNSYVIGEILRSLYHVAGRRTTKSFAAMVIGSIIKTLEQKYDFLKYIRIDDSGSLIEDDAIAISHEIDNIDRDRIGRAIEAIVRVVYMDMIGKAGLFFIAEIKKRAGEELITELNNYGVDLISLQIEQHYLYRSRERKKLKSGGKKKFEDVSLLGYTWKNVSSWKFDPNQKTCVLYNKNGEVLDNLHLETIIENYVKDIAEGDDEIPEELDGKIDVTDKEYELLKMLQRQDMDAESAMALLHIDKNQFDGMVKKLLETELLQYTSYNIIELTEVGISYISNREEKENSIKQSG